MPRRTPPPPDPPDPPPYIPPPAPLPPAAPTLTPPPDWRSQTVSLPLGLIVSVITAILASLATTGILPLKDSSETEKEIIELRAEVSGFRSDLRATLRALEEVRAIEDSAHPRLGVPPRPTPAPLPDPP